MAIIANTTNTSTNVNPFLFVVPSYCNYSIIIKKYSIFFIYYIFYITLYYDRHQQYLPQDCSAYVLYSVVDCKHCQLILPEQ